MGCEKMEGFSSMGWELSDLSIGIHVFMYVCVYVCACACAWIDAWILYVCTNVYMHTMY